MKNRILISPTSFGECGRDPLDHLEQAGMEIVRNSKGRRLTEEEVVELGSDCVGMIAGVEPLTDQVLQRLPGLKCISRCGVGMENVNLDAAKRLGIHVVNTPDGPTRAVAELTIGLMLALLRKVTLANDHFHRKVWKKETGYLLHKKVVGILGLGRIGRMVADLLSPFGCSLLGCDPNADASWAHARGVRLVAFPQLLTESDIVTIHLGYPADQPPLFNQRELEHMRKGSWLLNLSRGNVVHEKALHDALQKGHLTGAALDVFEQEPYNGPLCGLPNVIGTPHLGSYAQEAKLAMEIESVKNLLKVLTNGQ